MGRRPAYKLMGRMPVPKRVSALPRKGCPSQGPRRLTRRFHRLSAARGWVAYALRTRPPLSPPRRGDPARLACIRPAASVHPEPGSNSSLYYCLCFSSVPSHGLRIALLLHSFPFRPARPSRPDEASCAGLKLSKNFRKPSSQFLAPLPFVCGLQKYNLFI